MRLVDAHAHLQADRFANDVRGVFASARGAGVERTLVPGWDLESSRGAIALAAELDVDASAGIHPHVADDAHRDWAGLVEAARTRGIVAVGETGLDYDRAFSSRDAQLHNLRQHLRLAADLDRPVILHCRSRPGSRDAQDDLVRELRGGPPVRPVLHSFSGPVDYAEDVLGLGGTISFSGLVFRRGEEASAEVGRLVPIDRLLVETDSPYLSPPGAPRRRNEPRWVEVTARWLAERRDMDAEALGDALVRNYDETFGRRGAERPGR